MSDSINRVEKKLEEHFKEIAFDKHVDFMDQLTELSTLLKSDQEISEIVDYRFGQYKSALDDEAIKITMLLEGFFNHEKKYASEIYRFYETSKNPIELRLKDRCYKYLKSVEKFNPFDRVKNTFEWFGKSSEEIKSETSVLYDGLRGLNNKKLFLISANTSREDFTKLMTGRSIDEKVQWMETKNLFLYFIDELATTYLNLPESVESKFSDDTSKRKALMDWLNPKIIDCFQDHKGREFKAKQLTSLRSKLDVDKLKNKEVVDEIFAKIKAL